MSDRDRDRDRERERDRLAPARDPAEGVRIIGADEAAEAVERGDVQPRLGAGDPRYGDRPPSPSRGGAPALRFPLDSSADADDVPQPVRPAQQPRQPAPEVSHWAESGPEEVPHMSPEDPYEGDDTAAWSAFAGAAPRWRDDDPPPPPREGFRPPRGPRRRPSQEGEPFVFEDRPDPSGGRSVFGAPGAVRPDVYASHDAYAEDYRDHAYDVGYGYDYAGIPGGQAYDTAYDDIYGDESYTEHEPLPPPTRARPRPSAQRPRAQPRGAPGGERDMRKAVLVGAGLVVTALVLFQIDPRAVLLLVTVFLGLASLEYFTVTRRAGFDPLMPVGVTATVAMVVGGFYYGERALPLVLTLTVVVCLIWYLVGAGGERPMANVGATLLGVGWIGLMGAYAGLLLAAPNPEALLVAAIVPTIGYDVGALFVGRSSGSRPLTAASPNKTLEGLAGGMVLAVVGGLLLGLVGLAPFDAMEGLLVGVTAAAAAPLGDLCQSVLKRDLNIKDMGSVLPGHGGVLDRFDGLLFVLPAIWYLATVNDLFLG